MSPCMGCTDRHVGCHSSCAGYTEYKKENDKRLDAIKAFNAANDPIMLYKFDKITKRERKMCGNGRA